jgi:hypothetical protein
LLNDAGLATPLLAIRDSKLYRVEHKTFESYCNARWSFNRQRAYQLINAAEAAADVKHARQKPANARQAEALAEAPKESRAEVWEQVVVNGAPKVTAKLVQEVVEEYQEEEEPEAPEKMSDYLGNPVPEHAHEVFYDDPLIDAAIGYVNAAVKADVVH